jgi:ATP-dependent Clp protease ATP-binding subunit ClpB
VDEIVLFKPLQFGEIVQIVDLMVAKLRKRLEDQKVTLDLSDEARELIATEGFDPVYGARPLHRFIQREVETRIARALLAGEAREGAHVSVGETDGHLDVQVKGAESG